MRYAMLLLLCSGCNAPAVVDRADIIAALAVRYAAVVCQPKAAPTPAPPIEGCVEGCTCNGTGREKTGDGLSTVDCRCPDGCECKAGNSQEMLDSSSASKQETTAPVAKAVDEPPLVPVAPKQSSGRIECRNGTCYWIEGGRRYRIVR